jgi:hypothetical protein
MGEEFFRREATERIQLTKILNLSNSDSIIDSMIGCLQGIGVISRGKHKEESSCRNSKKDDDMQMYLEEGKTN